MVEGGEAPAKLPTQEHNSSSNVVALPQATERHSLVQRVALLPVSACASQTRKPFCFPDDSWSHAHHPHARWPPLAGQVAGEHVDACFGSAGVKLVHDAVGGGGGEGVCEGVGGGDACSNAALRKC